MIQYISVEDLNIFLCHKPTPLCLNTNSGDMSNVGDIYPDQNKIIRKLFSNKT